MDVSTRWWYGHLTVEQKTQDVSTRWWYRQTSRSETENTWLCLHVGGMDISQWNKNTWMCLHVGGMDITQWNKNTWMCLHVGGMDTSPWNRKHRDVSTLVIWTSHSGTENTGMCLHVGGMDITQWNKNTWMCLHVGGMDTSPCNRKHRDVSRCLWYGHLTVEQKTQGCVYTLVIWTSRSGTENTGMCLHGDGMNTSPWNRKHRDVSRCLWYGHLTVEQKTQECVYTVMV